MGWAADYAALLVGVEYADFSWDGIVSLAQSRDMKIKCSADGRVPLSGFGPPIGAYICTGGNLLVGGLFPDTM